MSRQILEKVFCLESKKCVWSSFLRRLRSAMSQSVKGRAFHASGPE